MYLKSILIAVTVLCWTATSHAAVVYNNIGSPSDPGSPQFIGSFKGFDFSFVNEWGDEVSLATPGPRAFESAIVAYSGNGFGGDETLTLNLYAMDGPPTPGSFGFNTPGTPLFTQTLAISNGDNQALFSDGSGAVLLPDRLTVGLTFDGIGRGEDYEIPVFDPPSIGSSFSDVWILSIPLDNAWSLYASGAVLGLRPGFDPARVPPGPSPELHINFGIQISAVESAPIPAPGAILLGMIGSGMVGWMRRHRTL